MKARIGGRMVRVSLHALERYQERVKPALSGAELEEDLRRMLAVAEITSETPEWALDPEPEGKEWAVLGDGIVFVISGPTILTCLTSACPSDETRARRAERRHEQAVYNGPRGTNKRFQSARQSRGGAFAKESRYRRRQAQTKGWE